MCTLFKKDKIIKNSRAYKNKLNLICQKKSIEIISNLNATRLKRTERLNQIQLLKNIFAT